MIKFWLQWVKSKRSPQISSYALRKPEQLLNMKEQT